MKILVTSLVEFDEVAERMRLLTEFTGGERDTLIECLDEFVAQKFDDCHTTLVAMPKHWRAMLHPVIVDTMRAMRHRAARAESYDPATLASMVPELRKLADIEGRPLGADSVDYPQFTFVAGAAVAAKL